VLSREVRRGLRRRGASLAGDPGATDLGGSSNYSSDTLEFRSGVGFRDNSTCSRVSRALVPGEIWSDTLVLELALRPFDRVGGPV